MEYIMCMKTKENNDNLHIGWQGWFREDSIPEGYEPIENVVMVIEDADTVLEESLESFFKRMNV